MSTRRLAPILVLAAACGGEAPRAPANGAQQPEPSQASRPADACALLPAAQVSAIIGQPVRDSLALSLPGPGGEVTLTQCNYATATNPAAVSLMLSWAQAGQEGQPVETWSLGPRQSLVESGVPVEDVAGIGDLAFFGGNQLHVFTRGWWYLIVTPEPAAGLMQARALAEEALGRL